MCYNRFMLNFDNASTTKISKYSLDAYVKASECYFNPSSLYQKGLESKKLIEDTRKYFLTKFKAKQSSTFIFTGSATEANNAVLNSCITRKDKKYIFSAGEHSSIYVTAKKYQEQGYNVEFISLNKNGSVNEEVLFDKIDDSVAFVSLIYVSNETGAINNIKEITKKIKEKNKNIIVHSDGVQALGKLDINLTDLNVDYFTMSAHKINGPKGIGALYISNPNKFKPFIYGGEQEMGLRASTENIPAIYAFKTAVENISIKDYTNYKRAIIENIEGDYILVSNEKCVDNIISICFKGVRGETIEHMLEAKGYLIGTGSACNSKAGVNRVLQPIVDRQYIEGAIRISFADDVTTQDCINLAKDLTLAVKDYRERIKR